MSKKAPAKTSKKSTSLAPWQHFNILAGLFFVLSFAVVTTLSAYVSLAAKPQRSLTTPNLSLSPSSQTVSAGTTLAVQIWADSGTNSVNAVQANLNYPIDKLNFVGIDTTNTAFGVEAQSTGGNGTVSIARGSTAPLSGKQLVATVKFTPLAATSKHRSSAPVSFSTNTSLISNVSNADILAAKYGGSYSL
jgi:hypothetical protein